MGKITGVPKGVPSLDNESDGVALTSHKYYSLDTVVYEDSDPFHSKKCIKSSELITMVAPNLVLIDGVSRVRLFVISPDWKLADGQSTPSEESVYISLRGWDSGIKTTDCITLYFEDANNYNGFAHTTFHLRVDLGGVRQCDITTDLVSAYLSSDTELVEVLFEVDNTTNKTIKVFVQDTLVYTYTHGSTWSWAYDMKTLYLLEVNNLSFYHYYWGFVWDNWIPETEWDDDFCYNRNKLNKIKITEEWSDYGVPKPNKINGIAQYKINKVNGVS